MSELPFLVEHGSMVWKLAVAAGGAAAVGIGWAWRSWRARRAAREVVAARAASATDPVAGAATLRGTLRGAQLVRDETTVELVGTRHVACGKPPRDGDEVLITGRLAQHPADVERGYREAAVAWILYPLHGELDVIALRPRLPRALGARGALAAA